MLNIVKELLLKIVDNIDSGNSNLSEKESIQLISYLRELTDKKGDVVIYYTVDEKQKAEIITELKELQPNKETFERLERNLINQELDTGFIYSSFQKKFSLIVIHKASSIGEFVNTFVHEKNHLEMHICEALDINPYSEEAAILSGETAMQILNEALYNIAEL